MATEPERNSIVAIHYMEQNILLLAQGVLIDRPPSKGPELSRGLSKHNIPCAEVYCNSWDYRLFLALLALCRSTEACWWSSVWLPQWLFLLLLPLAKWQAKAGWERRAGITEENTIFLDDDSLYSPSPECNQFLLQNVGRKKAGMEYKKMIIAVWRNNLKLIIS